MLQELFLVFLCKQMHISEETCCYNNNNSNINYDGDGTHRISQQNDDIGSFVKMSCTFLPWIAGGDMMAYISSIH